MHDVTVTLFNFHEKTGKWYPTVFHNVTLTETNADTSKANAGIISNDTLEALIRTAADKSVMADGATVRYVGPKEYAALENPVGYFTFNTEKSDFFITGDYASAAENYDDGYAGFYQSMNERYDGVYKVHSSAFYSLIPHFEIGGR